MSGAERIAAERQRQIDAEGWTPEHDAEHARRELACAARCYISAADYAGVTGRAMPATARDQAQAAPWPWHESWWKPSIDPIRNLEKAGALIAAEIDRLERIAVSPEGAHVCDVADCEAEFPTLDEVVAHEQTHDRRRHVERVVCANCGKSVMVDDADDWIYAATDSSSYDMCSQSCVVALIEARGHEEKKQ